MARTLSRLVKRRPPGVLGQVALAAGTTPAAYLRPRRVPRGTIIFLEGDPGESLYLIESRTVKIALTSSEGNGPRQMALWWPHR